MCSRTIQLFRKTSYDFTFLGMNETETIVVAPGIDVASYYRVGLYIRVHNTQMVAGQLITFELDDALPSDEDPAEFIERNPATGAPFSELEIDESDTAPALVSTSATGLGAGLRVRLEAQQASSGGTPFFIEMSGVLVLRNF